MIIEAAILSSLYILVVYFLAFRKSKWKSASDNFVKYYRVIVPTIVYCIPLLFHVRVGTTLQLYEFIPLFLGFTLWSLTPFLILVSLAGTKLGKFDLIFIATVLIAVELSANLQVHVYPSSSTDSLIFIFLPIFQMLLVFPVCLLTCYIFSKLYSLVKGEDTA